MGPGQVPDLSAGRLRDAASCGGTLASAQLVAPAAGEALPGGTTDPVVGCLGGWRGYRAPRDPRTRTVLTCRSVPTGRAAQSRGGRLEPPPAAPREPARLGPDQAVGVLGHRHPDPHRRPGRLVAGLRRRAQRLCARPGQRHRDDGGRGGAAGPGHGATRRISGVGAVRARGGTCIDIDQRPGRHRHLGRAPPECGWTWTCRCRPGTSRSAWSCRGAPTRFQYTVKDVGRPVLGTLELHGPTYPIGEADSFAVLDHGRGRWPYAITWNWAAGAAPGRAIQLGGQVDRRHRLDRERPLRRRPAAQDRRGTALDLRPVDWLRPWRISGDRVEVEFHPFHEKIARTNLGVVANETHQCFGHFSGWAETDDGTKVTSTASSAGPRRPATAGSSWRGQPVIGPLRTVDTYLRVYDRQPPTGDPTWPLGSARSRAEVRDGDPRGVRLLGARARRGRDPAGVAARPGPRRGAGPDPLLRGQPGHRDAGLRRPGARRPVRRDARAVPGGRLPRPGEVRLPQRRRGRAGPAGAARADGVLPLPAPEPRTSCRPSAVVPVPDGVPAARAVLAGTVETAVNALWDAAPLVGDRITVVGAGMVGCCVAALLARFPGRRRCELVDADAAPGRRRRRRSASTSRSPADAARRPGPGACTPAPPPPACNARWSCSRRRAPSSS